MPTLIRRPHAIEATGNKSMWIEEYVGRVNTKTSHVSIARVLSPAGRVENGKTPEFDEHCIVIIGTLKVESLADVVEAGTGQAVLVRKGEWVRFSTPEDTEYISICTPAFAPRMISWDRNEQP